jgi:hypothetical protein
MVSQEQIRVALNLAYKRRKDDQFLELLLRGVADPIKPHTEEKRRRLHPLLVIGVVLAVVSMIAILFFAR